MPIALLDKNVIIKRPDLDPIHKTLGPSETQVGIDYFKKYMNEKLKKPATSIGDKVIVVKAGTGSGKTSVLPPNLFKDNKIVVTVPTIAIAEAAPSGIIPFNPQFELGKNIGFQTSSVSEKPENTRGILFCTPGILYQKLINSKDIDFVNQYDFIMCDEIHRHTLMGDFLLSLIKNKLTKHYKDKNCPTLIMMSATMDNPRLYMDYFESTNYIEIRGGTNYKVVDIFPQDTVPNLTEYIIKLVDDLKGDTLVFLPTLVTIKAISEILKTKYKSSRDIIEIYGGSKKTKERDELFLKAKGDRIILATNIVEAGVTFPFLKNAIDAGIVNNVSFNPVHGTTVIYQSILDKYAYEQRKGRVGRVSEGKWFPCYPKDAVDNLRIPHPEVYTSDISSFILDMIIIESATVYDHINDKLTSKIPFDPTTLSMIINPLFESMQYSIDKLYILGLIEPDESNKAYIPTMPGYVCSKSMRILSLESKTMILTALVHKPHIAGYCVILGCCLAFMLKLGELKTIFTKYLKGLKPVESLPNDNTILAPIYYFQIISHIMTLDVKKVKQFFIDSGLDMDVWMKVIELYYEVVPSIGAIGIAKKNLFDIPNIWDIKCQDELRWCIYHGYKMNTYISTPTGYMNTYKNSLVYTNILHNDLINEIRPDTIILYSPMHSMNPIKGNIDPTIQKYSMIESLDNISVDLNYM